MKFKKGDVVIRHKEGWLWSKFVISGCLGKSDYLINVFGIDVPFSADMVDRDFELAPEANDILKGML